MFRFKGFTEKANVALNLAVESAQQMGHTYIGSEHLLLALVRESSGVAAHYLKERGVTEERLREAVASATGVGTPTAVSAADMTPRTKNIIEASSDECDKITFGNLSVFKKYLN